MLLLSEFAKTLGYFYDRPLYRPLCMTSSLIPELNKIKYNPSTKNCHRLSIPLCYPSTLRALPFKAGNTVSACLTATNSKLVHSSAINSFN